MVGRPNQDLTGFTGRQAGYREASASSQALFRIVTAAAGASSPLLPQGGGLFWTEHSERNGLPSVAASMGEHKDVINRLGRWQAEGSEAYVRTTRKIVMDFQMSAASRIREAGVDFLGEEQLLERFLSAAEVRHWAHPSDRDHLEDLEPYLNMGGLSKYGIRI